MKHTKLAQKDIFSALITTLINQMSHRNTSNHYFENVTNKEIDIKRFKWLCLSSNRNLVAKLWTALEMVSLQE